MTPWPRGPRARPRAPAPPVADGARGGVRRAGGAAPGGGGASTAELARRCDLPVATAARLLATPSPTRGSSIARPTAPAGPGLALIRLARGADPDRALLAAPPLLEELAAEAGESAALAVARPGPGMDVIAQADGPGLLGAGDWVGAQFPPTRRRPAKLILAALDAAALRDWVERTRPERFTPRTITSLRGLRAELDRIRTQGYAELDDELEPSLASLAVPVRGPGRYGDRLHGRQRPDRPAGRPPPAGSRRRRGRSPSGWAVAGERRGIG